MKRIVIFALVFLMVMPTFAACSSVDFTVSFVVDGEEYSSISTNKKEIVKMPQDPQKDGYVFKGWFWDEGTWQNPFTANSLLDTPLSSDMKVYACFEAIINDTPPTKDESETAEMPEKDEAELRCDRISDLDVYTVIPSDNADEIVDKFCDGKYNYFYFNLGEIKNVPVFCSNISQHKSQSHTITIENSSEISTMLEKTTDICITKGVKNTFSETKECSGSLGNLKDNMPQATMTQGITMSDEVSFNSSIGKTFTDSITQSTTNSSSNTLTLSEKDMAGYYRFVQLADFEVFAVLVCDIYNHTYYYEYITSVKPNSIKDGWYFGNTDEEMDIMKESELDGSNLEFDQSVINGLELYKYSDEDYRLLRLLKATTDKEFEVTFTRGELLYVDLSAIYNSNAVENFDISKVVISVKADLNSYSGKVSCDVKLSANDNKTTIKEKSMILNGEHKEQTVITCEMSYEDFLGYFVSDKKIYVNFSASEAYWGDLLDNDYSINNFEIVIEYIY